MGGPIFLGLSRMRYLFLTALIVLVQFLVLHNTLVSGIERQNLVRLKLVGRAALSSVFAFTICVMHPAQAARASKGSSNFAASCSGCHAGGGNTFPFAAKKNLFLENLQNYGYDSEAAVSELILKGKGGMPAYGEFISQKGNVIPARYSDEEVIELASFVIEQAKNNWK